MFAAAATFSVMDVMMKRLVEFYPPMQVTFMRGAASLPFLLAATALFGKWENLIPRRWSLHVLRGVLAVATLWLFADALRVLSLAGTYTIFMSAPLLITALSVPMLGLHIGWRRWLAVIAGLCGVIVVLRPSGAEMISVGGVVALLSALGYAFSAIIIRIQTRTDTSAAIVMWALSFLTVFSGVLSLSGWVPVQWQHWPWIAGMGLSGAFGQHFITEAFTRAPPPVVAPIEYTALAWGMLFDWLLWMNVPSTRMLIGASIIIGSGLYVLQRERLVAPTPIPS